MSRRITLDIENELSQRELQLLVHATKGLTDQAIANELAISLATIATYWGRIRIKLGPLNRTELVAKYLDYKSSEEVAALQNEVQVLREQLDSTKSEDATLFMALNKFPDSIVILDDKGTVIYVNEKFCRLTGYEPSEFPGRSFLDFYPEGRIERWQAWLKGMLSHSEDPEITTERTVYVRHANGSLVEFTCNSAMIETPAGIRLIVSGR